MKQLNEGRQHIADTGNIMRTAFEVEAADVGITQDSYLGQHDYTFQKDDVGRLLEVVSGHTPGFISWHFGSIFKDLREQYPNPKPYVKEE